MTNETTEETWARIKALLDENKAAASKSACPNCGYCPHCGRSAQPLYPAQPWYPQPYPEPYRITWVGGPAPVTTGGTSTIGYVSPVTSSTVPMDWQNITYTAGGTQ